MQKLLPLFLNATVIIKLSSPEDVPLYASPIPSATPETPILLGACLSFICAVDRMVASKGVPVPGAGNMSPDFADVVEQ